MPINSDITSNASTLAEQGDQRIAWALQEMPVLRELAARFSKKRPLQGVRISGCLHITTETANLALTLKTAGADLVLCAVYQATRRDKLDNSVHNVPPEIDQEVARLKLAAMNLSIDTLTDEQARYLTSWQEGT